MKSYLDSAKFQLLPQHLEHHMPNPSIQLTHQTPLLPNHWGSEPLSSHPLLLRTPPPPTYSVSKAADSLFSMPFPAEPHSSFSIAGCSQQSLLTGLPLCSCVSPGTYAVWLRSPPKCSSQCAAPLLEDVWWLLIACWSSYSLSLNSWAFVVRLIE